MSDEKMTTEEYLKILEDEWWITNLKRKISPEQKDKNHFSKVSNLKRLRIIDICDKHNLGCIFTDSVLMKALNKKYTIKGGGFPKFLGYTSTDIENYYFPDSIVRCFFGFEKTIPIVKVGKIKSFDIFTEKVEVEFDDLSIEILKQEQVTRIF